MPDQTNGAFEPKIVGFFCNWCTYTAADLAGTSRMTYAPNTRIVRFMCSGRVDPQFILHAFREGADGVLIGGCHPGDCHYQAGNYKALRRYKLLQKILAEMGIEPERLRLEWISASEGDRVQEIMNQMAEDICALGPLQLEPFPEVHVNGSQPEVTSGNGSVEGKPKVGFYWCASCGGCEEAVVDLNESILDVVEAVDIVFWPVAMDFKRSDVESMANGEITACFINGAVRTSEQEEMAILLRQKSKLLIAFGSCSHLGGIPGLGNLHDKEDIFKYVYSDSQSVVNEQFTVPQESTGVNGDILSLPAFYDTVRSLDQVVDVDYYLPGCAPPTKLIVEAVTAILQGELPAKGAVLAPNIALCDECPRKETKPDDLAIKRFYRPQEIIIDPEECLLSQGLVCLGIATRSGCGAACIEANMPCTGCLGPTDHVRDFGAKVLSALASIIDAEDESEIEAIINTIDDPLGTFYKYSLPSSYLYRKNL